MLAAAAVLAPAVPPPVLAEAAAAALLAVVALPPVLAEAAAAAIFAPAALSAVRAGHLASRPLSSAFSLVSAPRRAASQVRKTDTCRSSGATFAGSQTDEQTEKVPNS